jgi:DNA-binding NarL/FixJ family response regulator
MRESAICVVLVGDRNSQHAIRTLLANATDIVVVAETEDNEKLLDLIFQHQPNVTVLDLPMPYNNGVEVILRLRGSGSKTGILALCTSEDSAYIKATLAAGANGYVIKSSDAEEIIEGVRAVDEANQVLLHKYIWEEYVALKQKRELNCRLVIGGKDLP